MITIKAKELKSKLTEIMYQWSDAEGNLDGDTQKHVIDEIQFDVERPLFNLRFYKLNELFKSLALLLFIVLEVVLIWKFL